MTALRRKFWGIKLAIARQNHADEMRKMNGPGGASFAALERYAADIRKAERELGGRHA